MQIAFAFDLDGTLVERENTPPVPNNQNDRHVRALSGAVATLQWCMAEGYSTYLYSMGDQLSRLATLQIAGISRNLFRHIYAVPDKNPATYTAVLGLHQAQGDFLVYVGDSWMRDIGVALGRADAVVWVQGSSSPPTDLTHHPVWAIESVQELPGLLPEIVANPYRGHDKRGLEKYWHISFRRK